MYSSLIIVYHLQCTVKKRWPTQKTRNGSLIKVVLADGKSELSSCLQRILFYRSLKYCSNNCKKSTVCKVNVYFVTGEHDADSINCFFVSDLANQGDVIAVGVNVCF